MDRDDDDGLWLRLQHVTYRAGKKTRKTSANVATLRKGETLPYSTVVWNTESVQVPTSPGTSCKYYKGIQIKYAVSVSSTHLYGPVGSFAQLIRFQKSRYTWAFDWTRCIRLLDYYYKQQIPFKEPSGWSERRIRDGPSYSSLTDEASALIFLASIMWAGGKLPPSPSGLPADSVRSVYSVKTSCGAW